MNRPTFDPEYPNRDEYGIDYDDFVTNPDLDDEPDELYRREPDDAC